MSKKREAGNGFLFFSFFLSLLLTGCASIDSTEYKQTVLVQSIPPGAQIMDEKGQVLGQTPAYVRVRRGHEPKLKFRAPAEADRDVPLKSHYRWLDSGVSNLALLFFAPIGWAVDWATGNMWAIDDPPVELYSRRRLAPSNHQPVVAIAPPGGIDIESSDGLGRLVENKLKADRMKVLNYHDTAPIFDYYHSSEKLSKDQDDRYNLFYQLKADRVVLGQAVLSEDALEFKGEMKDAYTLKTLQNYDWQFAPTAASARSSLGVQHFYEKYLHFLPNTVFLNSTAYTPNVSIDGTSFKGTSSSTGGFVNTVLNYLGYLSFSHMERPRDNVKGHFVFGFVPALMLSDKLTHYDQFEPLRGITFNRFNVAGGYGAEVGHMSRYGFFYYDLVPVASWNQISFSNAYTSEKLSRMTGALMNELGYSYFFSQHLVIKAFFRTLNEDNGLWQQAIRDASAQTVSVSKVTSEFAGVALGYYIPSSLDAGEGWRVVSPSKKR